MGIPWRPKGFAHWWPRMVSEGLMSSKSQEIGHNAELQKLVIPAKAGIQYAAALAIGPQRLWNTGSSAFADDDN
jgi:hypothetical protein